MFQFVAGFILGIILKIIVDKMRARKLMKKKYNNLPVNQPSKRKPRLERGLTLIELLVYLSLFLMLIFFAYTCHYSIQDLSEAAGICRQPTCASDHPDDGEETGAIPQ